jgi:hypothetical protein
MYPDKFINNPKDIPDVEHWAIIEQDSVYIPGDERSRTNPGHGYPAQTRDFISYEMYLTEDKLLQAIKELEDPKYGSKKDYRVIKVTPMKVSTSLNISIK